MSGELTRRLTQAAILSIFAIYFGRPCLAQETQLTNDACPRAEFLSKVPFFGTAPATGTQHILRAPTFAKLASFENVYTQSNLQQIYVESGTRYSLYHKTFQRLPKLNLVLLENGLCTYLTDNDLSLSIVGTWYRKSTDQKNQSSAAFFSENLPIDCKGATITAGEIHPVLAEEQDKVTINYTNGNLNCDVTIPRKSANIVNLDDVVPWGKTGAFQRVQFSDYIGLSKRCDRDYTNTDQWKVGAEGGLNGGVKYGPINASVGAKGEISHESKTNLHLGDRIDYEETYYNGPDDHSFYWAVKTQCSNGQSNYELGNTNEAPLIWSAEKAKNIDVNESGRPIVTCPEQYAANIELLTNLGWADTNQAEFTLAQMSVWGGPTQRGGFVCWRPTKQDKQ